MSARFEQPITAWYAASSRDLPWRDPEASAWSILVSEIMLQQTPVSRVLPAHRAWLARWPTPCALAAATPADAVRQWDRLGYPRRAIRLHASARIIADRHGGEVPGSLPALLELPGVGAYTAAAVASFAFGQRHPVLDTNVRRVLARLIGGQGLPAGSVSAAETALAESLLPAEGRRAARWSVAVMELGALVCTSARPSCGACPVAADCSWRLRGSPAGVPQRRAQPYAGSDRQCRGALLAALRSASGPVPATALDACWTDHRQRTRVLSALITDGLAVAHPGALVGLPGDKADSADE
ncbi:MAG TPA: A/G-specific adenine glycosylase [Streptosporangiaceae bacterium]|nr:A/G-specific adenine glycosylase [Streptosporangiaceae bacterium]